jgi:hypothetical protein
MTTERADDPNGIGPGGIAMPANAGRKPTRLNTLAAFRCRT